MQRPLTEKLLFRIAGRIHKQFASASTCGIQVLEYQLDQLAIYTERLRAIRRRLQICRERAWNGPVSKLTAEVERLGRELSYAMSGLERAGQDIRKKPPSLRDIWAELKQARDEFGSLRYDASRENLTVVTEPVELEEVYLGPFEIRLDILSLTDPRHTPYWVEALDPHPAACNAAVTHPHVSEERLCPGDAGAAIRQALSAGRICDVFTLIRAVLMTYNSGSPYVSLDNWFGMACYECGYVMSDDDVRWCEICGRDYCSECASYCHQCDDTTCLGCLRTCPVCEEPTCTSCMTACPDCGRDLCGLCLDENLCPCHEEEGDEYDDEPEEADRDEAPTRVEEPSRPRRVSA